MPPDHDTSRRWWRFGFSGLLVLAMVAATQIPAGLGILAPFLRDDLGLSRTEIGVLITTAILAAGLLSPGVGRATDSLGGRRAVGLLFLTAGLGYIGLAVAPSYGWMLVAVAVAAIVQAGGNPATNKLIAAHSPSGRRGVVTGIKQSGVQAGIFVSGLLLPAIAVAWGWRWAFGLVALVPLVGLVGTFGLLPPDHPSPGEGRISAGSGVDRFPAAIVFLSVYGTLMGFGAAYTFLIPLFAEDALGMTEQAGGAAIGLIGFVSLFGRIGWSRYADLRGRHELSLAIIAVGSVGAVVLFVLAQSGASWLLWLGAVMTGITSSSWNSVGMLSVIDHAGQELSGRATGLVMLGFLSGLGVAPTLFGWLVDRTGSYTPMWLTSIGALALASLLAVWWLLSRTDSGTR